MTEPQELTKRQKQFLALCAQGKLNQEIAYINKLSIRTVENAMALARKRLNAQTTAQAILIAIAREELGLDHDGLCFLPNDFN